MALLDLALAHYGLTVDPRANFLPLYSDKKFYSLAEDIKKNKLKFPILLRGTELVDGRNRLCCCFKYGVTPDFKQIDENEDVAGLILSLNRERRELSKSQWAAVACEFNPKISENSSSASDIAKQFGISRSIFFVAQEIQRKSPMYFNFVKLGKYTVSKAYQLMMADFGPTIGRSKLQDSSVSSEEIHYENGKVEMLFTIEIPVKIDKKNTERLLQEFQKLLKRFRVQESFAYKKAVGGGTKDLTEEIILATPTSEILP